MRPMNSVRSRYGRPPVNDIRELYTDGDWVIYADSAMLVPTVGMTSQHAFIGPLVWSPESLLPEWWNSLPTDRPTNYLNLGSTGKISVLPDVLDAIVSIDANIMLATAGRFTPSHLPRNVWVADYIPGWGIGGISGRNVWISVSRRGRRRDNLPANQTLPLVQWRHANHVCSSSCFLTSGTVRK